jgi:hypothetical protein
MVFAPQPKGRAPTLDLGLGPERPFKAVTVSQAGVGVLAVAAGASIRRQASAERSPLFVGQTVVIGASVMVEGTVAEHTLFLSPAAWKGPCEPWRCTRRELELFRRRASASTHRRRRLRQRRASTAFKSASEALRLSGETRE